MKNMIARFFPSLPPESVYLFLLGMFWALILLVVLFLLTGFFWLLLRRSRKLSGITLNTQHGTLFIAASAISDLIYSLDDSFPDLEILRVRLIRDGKDLAVQVKVYYAAGGQSMLALTEAFQAKATEMLKTAFGIENISRIDLIVPRSKF